MGLPPYKQTLLTQVFESIKLKPMQPKLYPTLGRVGLAVRNGALTVYLHVFLFVLIVPSGLYFLLGDQLNNVGVTFLLGGGGGGGLVKRRFLYCGGTWRKMLRS